MRKIAFLLVLLVQVFSLGALEVAVEEVNKASNHEGIVFQNFTGVHQDVDTAQQIRNLGKSLASMSTQDNRLYTISNKYSVVEATNNENDNLYSAAVISIDRSARVDHIRNVRQIVAGYLEGKYNYSAKDADTLAFFLTFYNAIYRGNLAYLRTVYKPQVFDYLDESNAGISTNYSDWPGKTRLIIPLSNKSGVSLAHLGEETITSAKENHEAMAIEERESLQELKSQQLEEKQQEKEKLAETDKQLQIILNTKEGEAKTAQEQATTKQAEAQKLRIEAETAATTNAPDAKEKAAAAEAARVEAETAKAEAETKTTEAAQAQKEVEQQKQVNAQTEEEIQKLQESTQKEQQQLEEDKAKQAEQQSPMQPSQQQSNPTTVEEQVIVTEEETITSEEQPAQEQQPQTAQEQQPQTAQEKLTQEAIANPGKVAQELAQAREELENRPTGPVIADKFYYLSVSPRQTTGHYSNRIFVIDAVTGTILGSSAADICSINFTAYAGGVLVVTAREGSHAGPHNLTVLSLETLAPMKQTEVGLDIHWNSPVILNGGKIYALVVNKDSIFLARFNENLEIEAQGTTAVDGDTSITVYKDHVYANMTGQNKIVVFNKADLTTMSEITLPK